MNCEKKMEINKFHVQKSNVMQKKIKALYLQPSVKNHKLKMTHVKKNALCKRRKRITNNDMNCEKIKYLERVT